ncbi:hypothetical protein BU17DRAFT_81441 [Hysterangium stoloniferum]|nr:hypothetical protein BU17DRAFT_81441 [Hysterangium stoloniferum]
MCIPDRQLAAAQRLPAEIISYIIILVLDATDVPNINRKATKWFGIARVCPQWYLPAMNELYVAVAPSSTRACKLLLRTLVAKPGLGGLIKSLTFPEDSTLFRNTFTTTRNLPLLRPSLIQQLVSMCPTLIHLHLRIESHDRWWRDSNFVLQNYPNPFQLRGMASLQISVFGPGSGSLREMRHVMRWIQTNSVLRKIVLAIIRDSIRSFPEDSWPEISSLQSLQLSNITWRIYHKSDAKAFWAYVPPHHRIPPVVWPSTHIESTNTLYFSEVFETDKEGPEIFECYLNSVLVIAQSMAPTVETLTIVFPSMALRENAQYQFRTWDEQDLRHMVSLKTLHLSDCLIQRKLLLAPPPLLHTLIISVYEDRYANHLSRTVVDINLIFSNLPLMLKTLIFRVETNIIEEAWDFLARRSKYTLDPRDAGIDVSPVSFQHQICNLAEAHGIEVQVELE